MLARQSCNSVRSFGVRIVSNRYACREFARVKKELPRFVRRSEPVTLIDRVNNLHKNQEELLSKAQAAANEASDQIINDSNKRTIKEGEVDENNWNWVPPRDSNRADDQIIPVIKGVLLTHDEITTAFESLGAENIKVVTCLRHLEAITHLVVASGRSERHLRKLADCIVQAIRARDLTTVLGYKGAEGEKDDDWLCIDCFNTVVHVLLPETRDALKLEELWSTNASIVQYSFDEKINDKNFEDALELNPIPEGYGKNSDDRESGKKDKKLKGKAAKKKNIAKF